METDSMKIVDHSLAIPLLESLSQGASSAGVSSETIVAQAKKILSLLSTAPELVDGDFDESTLDSLNEEWIVFSGSDTNSEPLICCIKQSESTPLSLIGLGRAPHFRSIEVTSSVDSWSYSANEEGEFFNSAEHPEYSGTGVTNAQERWEREVDQKVRSMREEWEAEGKGAFSDEGFSFGDKEAASQAGTTAKKRMRGSKPRVPANRANRSIWWIFGPAFSVFAFFKSLFSFKQLSFFKRHGWLVASIILIVSLGFISSIDVEEFLPVSAILAIPITTIGLTLIWPRTPAIVALYVLVIHDLVLLISCAGDIYDLEQEGYFWIIAISLMNALICAGVSAIRLRFRRS